MGKFDHVKWLFFDIGDTLVNEWVPVDHIIGQFVKEANGLGYNITMEDVRSKFIQSYSNYIASPMQYAISELVPSEEDREYIKSRLKFQKELEEPYAEARAVLKQLGERYRIGIIANQSPGTEERMVKYGLRSYVDVIACSAEQGLSKPDMRLYQYALKTAGAEPNESIMIGDRIDNDIIPAKSLGMLTIRIMQGYGRYQPSTDDKDTPDFTVNDLSALTALLL
ncbi:MULTISPECIES: HAD family hydrolase [unclassified Paenibacillus]|uniref:HAD family hydrolase n=1 Tax=Paenibacillus provencensis TaxID=441151 RepID=A0ABW3PX89_9BACL|nr:MULTISPECIES: HAD family hydrolase [unclassified Paenibacillus]MCM3127637.1 HAD family hydrolase [Paenibacillus sp. MER 78]SFS39826.1 putative hydrolase of the HAD superfamily [Paenibacillus sp. 453mf]